MATPRTQQDAPAKGHPLKVARLDALASSSKRGWTASWVRGGRIGGGA